MTRGRLKGLRVFTAKTWDELTIAAALAKIAYGDLARLSREDHLILQAFRRCKQDLADASVGDICAYLRSLDEDQISGLVNNVKGIAHELIFVEMENEDGDPIVASVFADTNHTDTDVMMFNETTGESWEIQLKATDDESYVADWVEGHPDGDIMVTEELADELGLESTGVSNQELTVRVDDFIDQAMEDESLWDYAPALSVASVSIVLYQLYLRYRAGELTERRFVQLAAMATGWKAAKVCALSALLAVPGLNVAVGATLVARMITVGRAAFAAQCPSA